MEIYQAPIFLRKANPWDVMQDLRRVRIGQVYWLKSDITGNLDNKSYITSQSTSLEDIKLWLDRGMLLIPASDLDLKKLPKYKPVTAHPVTHRQSEISLS